MTEGATSPGARRSTLKERMRRLFGPRARTWAITVPLHLLAFVILYFATSKVMETEIEALASDSVENRLEVVSREIDEIAVAHSGLTEGGHIFNALLASQREINLQLLLPGGGALGPRVPMTDDDHQRIIDFFRSEEMQEIWAHTDDETEVMHGLRRVVGLEQCTPCHTPGETLAVAAMSTDLTRIMGRVRARSRRNLGTLLAAWAALLGTINVVVKRSIKRSAAKFERQLAAAGEGDPLEASGLVLDPASAWLYGALGDYLERQRERQAEIASRLEHTDQLASLGRLAAGLAHEIKNPLAGIQGALEILSEDNQDEQTGMLYGDMLSELGRVNTTLQLLLESARPSPPRLHWVDPENLIKETVYLLRTGLRRRGVEVRYEIAPGTGEAFIDQAKIRQVLINLIQNAAEAMESEGKIIVRAGGFPEQGRGLILAVEDDGPGIPAEQLARIFEPFFTTKFSGTGLGLAISKRLVEQHGGTLEVDSGLGTGTTFYVLLPADRSGGSAESAGGESLEIEREDRDNGTDSVG